MKYTIEYTSKFESSMHKYNLNIEKIERISEDIIKDLGERMLKQEGIFLEVFLQEDKLLGIYGTVRLINEKVVVTMCCITEAVSAN